MNKSLADFISRFGYFGFLRVILYPLTALVATPIRLGKALWSCRILIRQGNKDYHHFMPYAGLGYLPYWIFALILSRHGSRETCSYIGVGNYPLSRWFYYWSFSLRPYWKASAGVLLFGMFGWLIVHLAWLQQADLYWVIVVISLAAISTTFYANTFALQNYNVLGWLFFPLGLYGLFTESWIIVAVAWLLASLSSFTVVFIAGIISLVSAINSNSLFPILALLPAGLKLLIHLYPCLVSKNIKLSTLNLMKTVGIHRKTARYTRTYPLKTIMARVYFLALYSQFFIILYLITRQIPVLFLAGITIFVINSTFARFADVQSMHMLMFSLATMYTLKTPDSLVLVSFWLVVSPLPLLIPFPYTKKVLDVVPEAHPFSIKKLREAMEDFLVSVKPNERILMAFNNPGGALERIFDGYRALLQLLLYITAKKRIHFIPDWWAVAESNYQDARNFWGRDIHSVLKNIKEWKAGYIVVYQDTGTKLDAIWQENGFKVLSKFSWGNHEKELRGIKLYYGETPDWWLLEIPQQEVIQ